MKIFLRYNPKHLKTRKGQPWMILMTGGEWVKVDHVTSFVGFSTKETPTCKGIFIVRGRAEFTKSINGKTWVHIHPEEFKDAKPVERK